MSEALRPAGGGVWASRAFAAEPPQRPFSEPTPSGRGHAVKRCAWVRWSTRATHPERPEGGGALDSPGSVSKSWARTVVRRGGATTSWSSSHGAWQPPASSSSHPSLRSGVAAAGPPRCGGATPWCRPPLEAGGGCVAAADVLLAALLTLGGPARPAPPRRHPAERAAGATQHTGASRSALLRAQPPLHRCCILARRGVRRKRRPKRTRESASPVSSARPREAARDCTFSVRCVVPVVLPQSLPRAPQRSPCASPTVPRARAIAAATQRTGDTQHSLGRAPSRGPSTLVSSSGRLNIFREGASASSQQPCRPRTRRSSWAARRFWGARELLCGPHCCPTTERHRQLGRIQRSGSGKQEHNPEHARDARKAWGPQDRQAAPQLLAGAKWAGGTHASVWPRLPSPAGGSMTRWARA